MLDGYVYALQCNFFLYHPCSTNIAGSKRLQNWTIMFLSNNYWNICFSSAKLEVCILILWKLSLGFHVLADGLCVNYLNGKFQSLVVWVCFVFICFSWTDIVNLSMDSLVLKHYSMLPLCLQCVTYCSLALFFSFCVLGLIKNIVDSCFLSRIFRKTEFQGHQWFPQLMPIISQRIPWVKKWFRLLKGQWKSILTISCASWRELVPAFRNWNCTATTLTSQLGKCVQIWSVITGKMTQGWNL